MRLTPVELNEIPQGDGVVYFYHHDEESEVSQIEQNSPNCFFSPFDGTIQVDFLATVNRLAFKKKVLGQLLSNSEELASNEKRLGHLLKREHQDSDQGTLDFYYEHDSTLFNIVEMEELIQGIRKATGKKVKIIDIISMDELEEVGPYQYPIFNGKNIHILKLEFKKIDEHEEIFLRSIIFYWVNRFFLLTRECEVDSGGNSLWERIFSVIPLPMALISENAEILLHNRMFVAMELLPSQCLGMKSGEKIQVKDTTYLLDRSQLEEGVQGRQDHIDLFIFRSIGEEKDLGENSRLQKISSKELGIISSSIAHELNNPLGGVMAAISLLELDEWSEEEKQHLADMKESAKRCRDLIDIFLGFSKVAKNAQKICTIEEAIKQALNMLRFRMIESNLRYDFEFHTEENLSFNVNFSTATMLLYLIFGEVLTSINHGMLIAGKGHNHNTIKARYVENEDSVVISFQEPVSYQRDLMESKLVRYLIDTENLSVEIAPSTITITEWKLT